MRILVAILACLALSCSAFPSQDFGLDSVNLSGGIEAKQDAEGEWGVAGEVTQETAFRAFGQSLRFRSTYFSDTGEAAVCLGWQSMPVPICVKIPTRSAS